MPLYEYQCPKGHLFEVVQSVKEKPIAKCSDCSHRAYRVISRPTLLHNRGIYVYDRETKDDITNTQKSILNAPAARVNTLYGSGVNPAAATAHPSYLL